MIFLHILKLIYDCYLLIACKVGFGGFDCSKQCIFLLIAKTVDRNVRKVNVIVIMHTAVENDIKVRLNLNNYLKIKT